MGSRVHGNDFLISFAMVLCPVHYYAMRDHNSYTDNIPNCFGILSEN